MPAKPARTGGARHAVREGSALVACVNEALAALKDDGTLADLEEEWLSQGGDIPGHPVTV